MRSDPPTGLRFSGTRLRASDASESQCPPDGAGQSVGPAAAQSGRAARLPQHALSSAACLSRADRFRRHPGGGALLRGAGFGHAGRDRPARSHCCRFRTAGRSGSRAHRSGGAGNSAERPSAHRGPAQSLRRWQGGSSRGGYPGKLAMSRREPREIVIFSTADWATPYWTNKQHIASRLAKRGWSVLYVETVGLRAPGFGRADGARLMRRLTGAAASPREVANRLWVASPLSVPIGHRFATVRDFNAKALSSALGTWLAKLGFRRPIIWTYHPFMLAAIAGIDRAALVYHCVDELAAIPGIDAEAISAAERTLLLAADMVFTTSPALREKCAALSPACHHLPNVADIDHFAVARRPSTLPPDLAA